MLAALLLGVALVVALESLLRLAGVAKDTPRRDPFAGFSSTSPLFEPATLDGAPILRVASTRLRETNAVFDPGHQRHFLAEKPANGFRVFVLGGSSAAGVPYSPDLSFSGWLARILESSLPGRQVEVVNVAFSGYATRRVLLVAQEVARYQPDLAILYAGHNEWAERRFYAHLLDLHPTVFRLWEAIVDTRLYRLTSALLQPLRGEAAPPERTIDLDLPENAIEMFAVLGNRTQGKSYPSDHELAYRDMLYEHNLREIGSALSRARSAVMFLSLSQNLSDWSPGASRHTAELSGARLQEWQAAVAEGERLAEGDCARALSHFERALAIDDGHAELHYDVARCLHREGRIEEAREHYQRASDLDWVPHGSPSHFNLLLEETAAASGAIFVDTARRLENASGDHLVGRDLFVDYLHPNLRAHQLMAEQVAQALRAEGVPVAADEWQEAEPLADTADLYTREPALRTKELELGIVTCRLALRWWCVESYARELIGLEPSNRLAGAVLAGSGPWARPDEELP